MGSSFAFPEPPAGEVGRARANIAALQRLADVRRINQVTVEDRVVLGGWSGWGPMAKALDLRVREEPWESMRRDLDLLLSHEEHRAAVAATPTSFYTPGVVIDAIWQLVVGLGYTGGPVLEPGCGSGRFLAAAPEGAELVGVEADPVSAAIAALCTPAATIHAKPLQDTMLVPGAMAAAVGNVPFADVHVFDKTRPAHGHSGVHNYFIARAIEAVAPGGVVALITSRYTMDGDRMTSRQAFAEDATLIGAVRFPAGAFAQFGTDVVADLLVFRVGAPDPKPGTWTEVRPLDDGVNVNRYFVDHPEMVLGELTVDRGMYGRHEVTVTRTGDQGERLAAAVEQLIAVGRATAPKQHVAVIETLPVDQDGRKEGSFHLHDGAIVQVQAGRLAPVRENKELRELIVLRNSVLDLLEVEADYDRPDDHIELFRRILNGLYDAYVKRFGALNRCSIIERGADSETGLPMLSRRRPSMGGFRADPDYVTVLAVEDFDDATGVARKGPIFHGRINRRPEQVTSVGSVEEAIAVSIDRHGRILPTTVAALLDVSMDQAADRLGAVAFEDPALGWVPADEYLSGNVRVKLADAKTAAEGDPGRYHRNVVELTKIQPVELTPEEIRVRLGTPWVDVEDVKLFLRETLGGSPAVAHEPTTATWQVDASQWERSKPLAMSTWGTTRVDGYKLAEHALNSSAPIVYDEVNIAGEKRKVRNVDETMVATEKMGELSARFGEWVWEDPARADRLARVYNETFNSTVLRRFDGSHLTVDGLATWFKPYPHQLDQVYRSISTPAALCGHPVGAGKTAVMAMTAMKLRDLGLAHKPCAIVPNHLLEQIAREIKGLFPLRRILMAGRDDVAKEQRKLFAAKVATGDWDLVVMTHSAFTALGTGPKVEADYLAEQIGIYEHALLESDRASRSLKQVAKSVERMRERRKELLWHREDDGVSWEHLGVDYLLVDEAHYFKNLGFPTRVQGLSLSASKRAEDLALKLWHLRKRSNGARWATLLSGTLVSNSLAELYVLQLYAQPDRLVETGVRAADAWFGTFVEFESRIEVAPDGGSFRMHRRPSKFCNVPELRRMFGEVADIRTRETLGLPGPKVHPDTVVVPPSAALQAYVSTLVDRADAIRKGGGKRGPGEDNMLVVCTDGRKAALDLELVGLVSDGGKVPVVVERMLATWRATAQRRYLDVTGEPSMLAGALQIGFCDLGTPNAVSSQVYGKIRAGLIAGGMPVDRIRFVHEARTDNAKAALFAECRSGKISVLLGSTDKLGVGTNVQHRLAHIHHIDAPWRPADVEQRLGRGDRPGNQNDVLAETKYVREGSFDAYMWQTLERKARFISQVLTGQLEAREIDDIGETVMSYTEVKALATGNPLLLEQAEHAAEVTRLRRLAAAHARSQRRVTADAVYHRQVAAHLEKVAARMVQIAEHAAVEPEGWTSWPAGAVTVDDKVIADELAQALTTLAERDRANGVMSMRLGHWRGQLVEGRVEWDGTDGKVFVLYTKGFGDIGVDLGKVRGRSLGEQYQWRIVNVLRTGFDTLVPIADEKLLEAARLRAAADAADIEVGDFAQADELAAAEARLAAIDAAITAEVIDPHAVPAAL